MKQVVIENPILNSPYRGPTRHFRFDANNEITGTIDAGRRASAYFLPIATPKKKGAPGLFDTIEEKKTESGHVNRIRQLVKTWREMDWPDITPVTRALLEHWRAEDRFRPLFFCQIEAIETLVYVTEVAKQTKYGDEWIEKYLREKADEAGTDLFRVACKMATGSGKTVVMSMLIAWQVLNKRRYPHDKRFTDAFLAVAPGITIRDRLRVLLPSEPNNYYKELDIVPVEYRGDLGTAKVVVLNFHAFKLREKGDAGGLTKRVLTANTPGAFTESSEVMVNRVCKDLGQHREIMVIHDEAHHCYRGRPETAQEKMTREEASEAKARDEEARLWITGLEAVHREIGVKAVFDLSATPFYLKGSGYPEGTLFPWVVSDFSLMDAIECGIVKIPRVPIADNAMTGDYPKYRNLWVDIREGLKDVRRGPEDGPSLARRANVSPTRQRGFGPPQLPGLLEGALKSLYEHYQRKYDDWEADEEARANGSTPPVFIIVCNNVNVSRAVFDYIGGYETEHQHPDGAPVVAPGALELFNNAEDQRWLHRPNTILVDSRQLESGESMSDDFKKLAAHQIEEFKAEYLRRFPGRDTENLTDEDLMREVLNTVGKKDKLAEPLGDPGDSPNVDYGDDTFPGLLVFGQKKSAVCEKIKRAIVAASGGEHRLRAELPAADFLGTTAGVAIDTIKDCWTTDAAKCHFNLVPQESDWETIVCQKLEEMEEVRAYAKNQGIGFRVPYTCDGRPGNYYPDLIVKIDDGQGVADLLNLILEVSGQKKKEKDAKVQTAKTMWVPAVNNLGAFGRWQFLEIDESNLHKTKQEIRKLLIGGFQ